MITLKGTYNGHSSHVVSPGGDCFFKVDQAFCKSYSGEAIRASDKVYINIRSGHFSADIRHKDGSYLHPHEAKGLFSIIFIADDAMNLDDISSVPLAFYNVIDTRPDQYEIVNKVDPFDCFEEIPILVKIVD